MDCVCDQYIIAKHKDSTTRDAHISATFNIWSTTNAIYVKTTLTVILSPAYDDRVLCCEASCALKLNAGFWHDAFVPFLAPTKVALRATVAIFLHILVMLWIYTVYYCTPWLIIYFSLLLLNIMPTIFAILFNFLLTPLENREQLPQLQRYRKLQSDLREYLQHLKGYFRNLNSAIEFSWMWWVTRVRCQVFFLHTLD